MTVKPDVSDEAFESARLRFYIPDGTVYLDGNSLGLLNADAEEDVLRVLSEWKRLGVRGWLEGNPPWFTLCESLAARVALLIGASPDRVAVTGSTTGNIHQIVATLYRPSGKRKRILADSLNFPTDLYALRAQVALHGGDPVRDVVLVPAERGGLLDEDRIIESMDETIALSLLPHSLYRTAQVLDAERITKEARRRGITIGWDLSHSIGVIRSELDRWGADFAVWCHYKYLNAGPGAIAGLYVHNRHDTAIPALPGWWGSKKERQFTLALEFDPAAGAGAFQIGTPSILGVAALGGALRIVEKIGIDAIRERSLLLTGALITLVEQTLPETDTGIRIATPRADSRRGGHVALEHREAARINAALKAGGIIPDCRPPDTIRLCPAPLHVRLSDVERCVAALAEIVRRGLYRGFPDRPDIVA